MINMPWLLTYRCATLGLASGKHPRSNEIAHVRRVFLTEYRGPPNPLPSRCGISWRMCGSDISSLRPSGRNLSASRSRPCRRQPRHRPRPLRRLLKMQRPRRGCNGGWGASSFKGFARRSSEMSLRSWHAPWRVQRACAQATKDARAKVASIVPLRCDDGVYVPRGVERRAQLERHPWRRRKNAGRAGDGRTLATVVALRKPFKETDGTRSFHLDSFAPSATSTSATCSSPQPWSSLSRMRRCGPTLATHRAHDAWCIGNAMALRSVCRCRVQTRWRCFHVGSC